MALHVAYIEIILDILNVDLVTLTYNLIAEKGKNKENTHTYNVNWKLTEKLT